MSATALMAEMAASLGRVAGEIVVVVDFYVEE